VVVEGGQAPAGGDGGRGVHVLAEQGVQLPPEFGFTLTAVVQQPTPRLPLDLEGFLEDAHQPLELFGAHADEAGGRERAGGISGVDPASVGGIRG
jgi:hypothetical protein